MASELYTEAVKLMMLSHVTIPIKGPTGISLANPAVVTTSNDPVNDWGLSASTLVSISSENQNDNDGPFEPASALVTDNAIANFGVDSFELTGVNTSGDSAFDASVYAHVVPQFDDLELKANWNIIRLLQDDLGVALVNTQDAPFYTFDPAHTALGNIGATEGVGGLIKLSTSNPSLNKFLRNKTVSLSPTVGSPKIGRVLKADPITIEGVPAGAYGDVDAVVIYKWTGSISTSPVIAYIDQGSGFNISPVGQDITIQWAGDPLYCFRIRTLC